MSLILSLDTSTAICSAAIHDQGKLLASGEVHMEQAHGSKLAPLIKSLCETVGIYFKDLKGVAITSGPGSYTGLRIGTSTAKGLCFALNVPLLTCDVLTVMSFQVVKMGFNDSLLCPMLDARRMEVYCALYDHALNAMAPMEAKVIDDQSYSALLEQEKVVFFGDGAEKCKPFLQSPNARFLDHIYPSASILGELAYGKFLKNDWADVIHFEPIYLKEFLIKKSNKMDSILNK